MSKIEFERQVAEMDRMDLENVILECEILDEEPNEAGEYFADKTEAELRALVLASFTDTKIASLPEDMDLADFSI